MSINFDTGLHVSTREAIVQALAAQLSDLRRPTRYLAAIVTVPIMSGGKGDDDFLVEISKASSGRVPCVAIAMGGSKSENEGLDTTELGEDIEIGVYVVSANARGTVEGRLYVDANAASNDTKDPGVFAILQHVTERLHGADLEIDGVEEPRKSSEEEVFSGDDATVWGQTYRVRANLTLNPNRAATTVLTSIEAKHKGDGIPDASSLDPFIDTISTLAPED